MLLKSSKCSVISYWIQKLLVLNNITSREALATCPDRRGSGFSVPRVWIAYGDPPRHLHSHMCKSKPVGDPSHGMGPPRSIPGVSFWGALSMASQRLQQGEVPVAIDFILTTALRRKFTPTLEMRGPEFRDAEQHAQSQSFLMEYLGFEPMTIWFHSKQSSPEAVQEGWICWKGLRAEVKKALGTPTVRERTSSQHLRYSQTR